MFVADHENCMSDPVPLFKTLRSRVKASMGLFNVSEPYEAITRSLAYTIQAG